MYDIKYGMLQVRENEISLRKGSGGTAQLHSLEGTLIVFAGKIGFPADRAFAIVKIFQSRPSLLMTETATLIPAGHTGAACPKKTK